MMHWEWGADFAHIIMNERKRRFLGIWGGVVVGWGRPWGLDFLGFVNPTSMPNWVSRVHPRDLWFLLFFFLIIFFRVVP